MMEVEIKNGRRYAVLTRIVQIPFDAILSVRRARSGTGSVVITDRGSSTVLDGYEEIMSALYGDAGTR